MSYNDDLIKIRSSVADLLNRGAITPLSKDLYEGTLVQLLNDAERNRQSCMSQADNLKRQSIMLEGQASAFAAISSMVVAVLNGFVLQALKNDEETAQVKHDNGQ